MDTQISAAAEPSPQPESDSSDPNQGGSHLPYPVVGIGASAGCVAALQAMFSNLPSDTGMAFVIVLHLSPEHESHIDAILQRDTAMQVTQVREPVFIEPNHVYVISPALQLEMVDGRLRVEPLAPRPRGRHFAIDLFFRTLAAAQRERAYCVVLSGTGSDGAAGLARVKECGGVAIVQLPEDAEYGDMPRMAIASGDVDFVLPAREIAARLVQLWENMKRIEMPEPTATQVKLEAPHSPNAAQRAEQALAEVLRLLKEHTGHDFSHYKRATVLRRIERRLQVNALSNLPEYRDYLRTHSIEAHALLKDLLISVTQFFRDRDAFDALERHVDVLLDPGSRPRARLRAWVAGCATGEEAYSVAMLLTEALERRNASSELQLFASDIDEHAIAHARRALYSESAVSDIRPARLRHFMRKEQGQVRVQKELRERVLFAVHNLLRDPPFSDLDLICCRNLLIYLDREVQEQVLQVFHFALRPGGLLFLGLSESADGSPLFTVLDKKHRIYGSIGLPATPLLHDSLFIRPLPSRRIDAAATPGRPLAPLPAPVPQVAAQPVPQPTPVPTPAALLRTSIEELHERLRDAHASPSVLIDEHDNILHSSLSAESFLRFTPGRPSQKLIEVVRPELQAALRGMLFRARESDSSVAARRVRFRLDGIDVWIDMHARPIQLAGEVDAASMMLVLFEQSAVLLGPEASQGDAEADPMLAALEDELRRTRDQLQSRIDESAASDEELRASNEELQAINEELVTVNQELKSKIEETGRINDDLRKLITATNIAAVFVDRDMRIKRFTPRASQLFNLIASDIGRSLLDITHRLDYDELQSDAVEVFETLAPIEREVEADDGRIYLARVLPYRTEKDVIDGAVLNFVDVSAMRRAQRQLAVGEENLRRVVESTQDYAIILLDTQGIVTQWNPGAVRVFGFEGGEMIGQPIDLIFSPEDRAAGRPLREREEARAHGRAEDERWHLRKDGSRVYCSGIMTPLHEHGELLGYAKIARDLTSSKNMERQLERLLAKEQQAGAELQRAAMLKDEFLAVMSHELKHPLNLIHVNAELLARLPEARALPAMAQAADVIRRTVLVQAKVIDDLLDLSRLRTGKLTLERRRIEWADLIARVCDAVAPDADAARIEIETALDPAASAIDADPVRVEQIVWNLLSNALKFTPAGGRIEVRLSLDGDASRLDVRDTGQGLAPEMLEQVFDMFRQADRSTVRARGGMGIGLALVRQLAQAHGGRAQAASPGIGHGATFSVWLPRSHAVRGSDPAEPAAASLAGLRILLVDDTQDTLLAFATLLRLEGAEIVALESGALALEAVDAAGAPPFDLILSDVAMPQMDGHELIAQLRTREATRAVPAIALTGFGRTQDVQRARAAGFDAHLSKPVVLEELLALILRLSPGRDRR